MEPRSLSLSLNFVGASPRPAEAGTLLWGPHLSPHRPQRSCCGKCLSAFSVIRSLRSLVRPAAGNLAHLDGLRALAVLWVIAFHSLLLLDVSKLRNPGADALGRLALSKWMSPILAGDVGVDLFLVLSGYLMALILVRRMGKEGQNAVGLGWVASFLGRRWLRITPIYALLIALNVLAGANCKRWWWTNLLFVNNLVGPGVRDSACIIQSWSIALEVQLYVLSPPVIALMWRANWGAAVPLLLALGSVAARAASIGAEPMARFWSGDTAYVHAFYSELALKDLYDKPWTRGSPFFFGVLAHWCVHKRREWITTRFALRKADGYGTPRTLAAGRSALLRGSVKDLGSPLTASHWDDDILTSSQSIAVRVLSALISLLMAAVASAVVLFGAGDNLGGQLCSWLDVCAGKALGRAVLLQLLLARALFGAVCAWLIYAIEIESDPGAELAPDGSEQSRSWAARFLSLRLFAPVARLSYSAYLIQFLAMGLLPNALLASGSERIPLSRWANGVSTVNGAAAMYAAYFALALVATFGLALLMYVLVERPFMALRDI